MSSHNNILSINYKNMIERMYSLKDKIRDMEKAEAKEEAKTKRAKRVKTVKTGRKIKSNKKSK